jgi:hypothetical protein
MNDDAVICPHCRREPSAILAAKRQRRVGCGFVVVGVVAAALIGLVALGNADQRTPSQRAKAACDEQFPYDTEASQTCQIKLLAGSLLRQQDEQQEAAKRAAGL